ncbi:MAG: hypothetical protein ABR591_09815, partial [Candidatus Velthaea sp.]
LLANCGGGSSSTAVSPQVPAASTPAPVTVSAPTTVPLAAGPATYAFPPLSGFSGGAAMPAPSSAVTGTMSLASAVTPPCGSLLPLSALRRTQSQTVTVVFCATFTPSVDITFQTVPAISLAIPIDPTGMQFFYAISQPPTSPAIAQFRQEGPAHITTTTTNGCVLAFEAAFGSDNAPLSFKAGVPVVFAFYSEEDTAAPSPAPSASVKPTPAPTASPIPAGTVTEFHSGFTAPPGKLALGSDGNVYFTESAFTGPDAGGILATFATRLGSITPAGTVSEFSPLAGFSNLDTFGGITAGPGGAVFYSGQPPCFGCPDAAPDVIGELSGGTTSVFAHPHFFYAINLTMGPDGNVWYAGNSQGVGPTGGIGHTSSSGVVEFQFPRPDGAPISITNGPDGNVWFTAIGSSGTSMGVGKITTAGLETIVVPFGTVDAQWITTGPDGNVWTSGKAGISRITPSGTVTSFADANAITIAAGPDGNLWFTAASPARVGRITPQGTITEFTAGITGQPSFITAGSDGYMYFSEGNGIGKIKT